MAITVGATTVNALMYYTSANQVAALIPSNAPNAIASFRVTYNGETSNALTRQVAGRTVGIFTVDSSGQGPALITYPDYSLVSAVRAANCGGPDTSCGAANPGDTLILWATGMGPVSGNEAAGDGLGQDMPTAVLTIWLGGVQAPVIYKGRSGCCVGLDQIVFTVPPNVPTGCAVPIVAQINMGVANISNTALLAVANGSRNCTPSNQALATIDPAQLLNLGSAATGDIDLERNFNSDGSYLDQASFQFLQFTFKPGMQPFFLSFADDQPAGTCRNYYPPIYTSNLPIQNMQPLDAGASVTVSGPKGSATVPANNGNLATIGAGTPFLEPGSYTVTGNGGSAIGSFRAAISIPAVPALLSPVAGSTVAVSRTNGMTVTWKGGDPNANVILSVRTLIGMSLFIVECKVNDAAQTFTIPPYVLLPFPTGYTTYFALGLARSAAAFTATGIVFGNIHNEILIDGATLTLQ